MSNNKSIKEKRKWIMDRMCKMYDKVDPSGYNSNLFRESLDSLSDKEFESYMNDFLSEEDNYFYLEIKEFERELKIDNIMNALDFIGAPLFETVYIPHNSIDPDIVPTTPEPVIVGYWNVKLMVQMLLKKNSISTDINKRSAKTGQVIGDNKTARTSDTESYSLISLGAYHALTELMKPRADDMSAKNQMYNEISKKGWVSEKELVSDVSSRVAIKTLDIYFLIMGIKTNLVYPKGILPSPRRED